LLGPTIGRRTEQQGLRHPTAVRKPFARLSFSAILILPSVDDSWGNQHRTTTATTATTTMILHETAGSRTMQQQLKFIDNSAFSQSLHPLCPSGLPRIPLVCPEGPHL